MPFPSNPSPEGFQSGTWARLGILLAVVTNGFSQFFFNFIISHPTGSAFSTSSLLAVIFWVQLLPLAMVFAIDLLLERWVGIQTHRIWRASLYTFTALSLMRQAQIASPGSMVELSMIQWVLVALIGAIGIFVLCYRAWRGIGSYLAWLGVLAPILVVVFVVVAKREWKQPSSEKSQPSVFILVFDALSLEALLKNDRIDPERFPNFTALAERSAWFRHATPNDLYTKASVRRLLTGSGDTRESRKTIFHRIQETLPVTVSCIWPHMDSELLGPLQGRGHFQFRGLSHLIERNPTPKTLAVLFQTSFGRFQRDFLPSLEIHGVSDDHAELLLDLAVEEGNRLVYWHGSLPHPPMVMDGDGNFHRAFPLSNRELFMKGYLEQVERSDLLLGRFLAKVSPEDILIVTSDHGLQSGSEIPNTNQPLNEWETRVPFFVRHPRLKPGIYDQPYQHLDFAPTLLDLLKIPYDPKEFAGTSVLAPVDPPRLRFCISQQGITYKPDEKGVWQPASAQR